MTPFCPLTKGHTSAKRRIDSLLDIMEGENKFEGGREKEIVFSKVIKAGKRIYYVDVKENRHGELYLALTESKKVVTGSEDAAQITFEKHKLFLYREDFEKFMAGLQEALTFIEDKQGKAEPRPDYTEDIKIDLEF